MKRLIYLCSLSALMACKPVEKVVYVPEVHTVTTEVATHDTVIVTAIPEHYAERETLDTLSELTNPFSYSRAEVSGGRLSHSLGTHGELPTSVRIEEKIITIRDTIPYRVEVPVYIDKPMPVWQQSLIGAFLIILLFVGGCVLARLRL